MDIYPSEPGINWCSYCQMLDHPILNDDFKWVCAKCGLSLSESKPLAGDVPNQVHYSGVYAAPQGECLYAAPIAPNGRAVESVTFTVAMEVE